MQKKENNCEPKTFLIRPFDRILIREDPVWKGGQFTLETLNNDLTHGKDKATIDDFPKADSVEEFFRLMIEDEEFFRRDGMILIGNQIRRPGWVRVVATHDHTVKELWQLAMDKVAGDDLYEPEFLIENINRS